MIWLANPRTASHSVADALCKGGAGFDVLWGGHHAGIPSDAREVLGDRSGWTIACNVRNHYDALVSWWFYQKRKMPLGPAYVEHVFSYEHFPVAHEWWALHARDSDTILHFENLELELNQWLATRGLESVELPHVETPIGTGSRRQGVPWEPFIDQVTSRYIWERFKAEMTEYGYTRYRG